MLLNAAPDALWLLAQFAVPEWLATGWYLLLVLLGFSLVVFFHELGHFLAAKWAGVRVERFAIGFGRELLGFTRGETRYSFNLLPLGGYVKMLGQEDFAVDKTGELKVRDDPGSFTSKPVGKRMVIVSAGVVMNIIFAAVAFTVVNMLGHDSSPAIVGTVVPGSAAERAGLRPGDRITAVNGSAVREFNDLMMAVVLSDSNEELELTIQRDGKPVEPRPRVLPEFRPEARVRQIGLSQAVNRRVQSTARLLGYSPDDELRPNDVLDRMVVDGREQPVRDFGEVCKALMDARGAPVEFIVKRPTDAPSIDQLTAERATEPSREVRVKASAWWLLGPTTSDNDLGSASLLGLVPRLRVMRLDPRGPAALAGLDENDIIVRAGPLPNPTLGELQRLVEQSNDRDLPIAVRRPNAANGPLSAAAVSFLARHREALIAAARTGPDAAAQRLQELAAAAQLPAGDLAPLSGLAARKRSAAEWTFWLEQVDVHLFTVRPKAPSKLFGETPKPTLGITLALPAEDDWIAVCDVQETLRERPSPARVAGVSRGAIVVGVDGKPVQRWSELTEAFRDRAGETVQLELREGDRLRTIAFRVPQSISTLLNLSQDATITEIDGQDTVELQDARGRTRRATLADWTAVESVLRKNAGKTVRVKIRLGDGTAREAEMAVTDDNADPWLMRVMYAPSFNCYPLREFVRESNPVRAMVHGFRRAYGATIQTYLTIKHIVFTREVGVENISGPVGILRTGSQVAEGGLKSLLMFLGIISVNLAVINFLPLPIVDGGLFVFLLLEKIRGEPVSIKTQVVTQLIGIALIVTLFVFVTIQDIANWNR